jgi:tetratricopeptide (TPR) repeat protein
VAHEVPRVEDAFPVTPLPRLRQSAERARSNPWRPGTWGLLLAAPAFAGLAAVLSPATTRAGQAGEFIAAGDRYYAAARLEDAVHAYTEAVQAAPAEANALCRLARAESELGETQKGDEQRRTWANAVVHARDAVRAEPDSALPHVRLAVALGRQALREGPRTKLALSKEIKSEVDRALALDPAQGLAWHVLAVWNVKVTSLNSFERMAANVVLGGVPKGASYDNAEQAFQKAVTLDPDYVNHHVEYGRLLKDLHKNEDARRELEKALALPATSSALDARYQSEARALLEKLPH